MTSEANIGTVISLSSSAKKITKTLPRFDCLIQRRSLSPLVEKKTKGHGGKRAGAGRPKGSVKEKRERISLPKDLASWFKHHPEAIELTRKTMRKHRAA